jgi:hypothetical protein
VNAANVPIMDYAQRKETLIREALKALREARDTDEQLGGEVQDWAEYYDRNLANVTNIESVVGAIRIEMMRRRGERLGAPKKTGGDRRFDRYFHAGNIDSRTKAQRIRESVERVIFEEAEAVNEYVQERIAAGQPPTTRGALERARKARRSKKSPEQNSKKAALHRSSRVPQTAEGTKQQQLQRLCAWFTDLQTKIEDERRANNEQRGKKHWNMDDTSKAEQHRLLDFIQAELDKVPELFSVMK